MLKRAPMLALVVCLSMVACGSGGPPKVAVSRSKTSTPPTEAQVKAAFLTDKQIGPGFTGGPPTKGSKNLDGKDPEPVCGIKIPKRDMQFSVLFAHESQTTQVFEDISVFPGDDAEKHVAARKAQAEARCEFDESVGETDYHVKVEGPIPNFPSFGDSSTGTLLTYSGEYKGQRYAMTARIGVTTVYMEYTAPELNERFGILLFRKAVDVAKASLAS